jgi:DNA-binding PadR family transcriptional regulator
MVKLTHVQEKNLRSMAAGFEIAPITSGIIREMQELARLGLAVNVSKEPQGEIYDITPAGRAWLAANKQGGERE